MVDINSVTISMLLETGYTLFSLETYRVIYDMIKIKLRMENYHLYIKFGGSWDEKDNCFAGGFRYDFDGNKP
jgi:hypothetical protein